MKIVTHCTSFQKRFPLFWHWNQPFFFSRIQKFRFWVHFRKHPTALREHAQNDQFSASFGCQSCLVSSCSSPDLNCIPLKNMVEHNRTVEFRTMLKKKDKKCACKIHTPAYKALDLLGSILDYNVLLLTLEMWRFIASKWPKIMSRR